MPDNKPDEYEHAAVTLRSCERMVLGVASEIDDVELRAQLMELGAQITRNQCWLKARQTLRDIASPPATPLPVPLDYVAVDGVRFPPR